MDGITEAQRQAAAGAVVITASGIGYITMFAGNRLPMCYVGDAWVIDTRPGSRQNASGSRRNVATGRQAQSVEQHEGNV